MLKSFALISSGFFRYRFVKSIFLKFISENKNETPLKQEFSL